MENSKKRGMKEVPNYHMQARLDVRSIESAVSLPNTLFGVRGCGKQIADIELTLGISSTDREGYARTLEDSSHWTFLLY
jgi:hypothetical protein